MELNAEPGIEKAITVLVTLYLTESEREVYEGHLKWLRDEDAAIELAEHRGKIEGKIEIAKALKASGMSVNDIQKYTGISLSDISGL